MDIKLAFRLLPINPAECNLLGIKLAQKYYIDKCLPIVKQRSRLSSINISSLQERIKKLCRVNEYVQTNVSGIRSSFGRRQIIGSNLQAGVLGTRN